MSLPAIGPFVIATANVFHTMLQCSLSHPQVRRKRDRQPLHEVSGLVRLHGDVEGLVILGLSRAAALRATELLLGEQFLAVNETVRDAVGELTNIIAGNAKVELGDQPVKLGLPEVLVGKNHLLPLPTDGKPVSIVFASDWGPVAVEVALAGAAPATIGA